MHVVAKLAAFDFGLKYVPGVKNTVADALRAIRSVMYQPTSDERALRCTAG